MLEDLLGTGIRLESLVGLNVGDVDLKQDTLQIKAKGGNGSEGSSALPGRVAWASAST